MHNCLSGVRVLDLSRVLAGPYCTAQLSDFGATVIKIEAAEGGDQTRHWGPPFNARTGVSAYFESVNRNKKTLLCDLKQSATAVREIAKSADVVVENSLPEMLAKYQLDYPSLAAANPALVYCSITGYGQSGDWRGRPGYDFIIQGESGLMALGGEANGEAMKTGVAVCDVLAGLNAAQAIMAALLRRRQSGQGAHIDISLLDCAVAALVNVAQAAKLTGQPAARYGNHHPHIVPYGMFYAADGPINIAVGGDQQFARLCDILQKPQWATDVRFANNPARVQNRNILLPLLDECFAAHPTDYWLQHCHQTGIPAGQVLNIAQTLQLPHIQQRQLWHDTKDASLPNSPVAFCDEPKPQPQYPKTLGDIAAMPKGDALWQQAAAAQLNPTGEQPC